MTQPWSAGSAMLSNAAFIKQELPKLHLGHADRTRVLALCQEWESIYFDLIDCGPVFAERWVREGLELTHGVVAFLQVASIVDPRCGTAFVLVSESAANVLNAFSGADDEAAVVATGPAKRSPKDWGDQMAATMVEGLNEMVLKERKEDRAHEAARNASRFKAAVNAADRSPAVASESARALLAVTAAPAAIAAPPASHITALQSSPRSTFPARHRYRGFKQRCGC